MPPPFFSSMCHIPKWRVPRSIANGVRVWSTLDIVNVSIFIDAMIYSREKYQNHHAEIKNDSPHLTTQLSLFNPTTIAHLKSFPPSSQGCVILMNELVHLRDAPRTMSSKTPYPWRKPCFHAPVYLISSTDTRTPCPSQSPSTYDPQYVVWSCWCTIAIPCSFPCGVDSGVERRSHTDMPTQCSVVEHRGYLTYLYTNESMSLNAGEYCL